MEISLSRRVLRHGRLNPHAPALLGHGRTTTYRELLGLAATAAAGLGPRDGREPAADTVRPVALVAAKSPAAVAVVLGALLVRRPLLLVSPELGEEALTALLSATGAERLPDPEELVAGEAVPSGAGEPAARDGDPGDTALLLTTSGSTGLPKVVPLSFGAVDRFTGWAAEHFGLTPESTVLSHAPLNFDLCLLDIWTTLGSGGCVSLVDPGLAGNPAHLRETLQARPVDLVQGVPLLYDLLARTGAHFGSVRHVLVTGEAMAPRAFAALPELFPGARFHNVYGCTETNDSFVHEIDPAGPMPYGSLPLGREPVPGAEAWVRADDGTVLRGPGRGELVVRTPFQATGYLVAGPAQSPFVAGPDDGPVPWYRTGDLVRRHKDGTLTLEGRRDFVVKVRGVRINTAEVEAALSAHPEIVEAAVLALPDERAGKRLHAVVRRADGSRLNNLSLRQYLAQRLPRAAVPSTVAWAEAPLPRTSTGKVDRALVARPVPAPAGD
ncbi:AMP-binding protein [Streptomyces sp. NPDC001922]|uniref:AMP-binding protein n=1 Tax=Streptomyces sp. NPDC001922 TaxID=3364624 RepID=UPI0036AAE2BB